MHNSLYIFSNYELNSGLTFQLNYQSIPSGFVGTSLTQNGYILPLLNNKDNSEIGKIEFINTVEQITTYPAQYFIVESITIRFNNNSAIFASNYFTANNNHYNVGDKIIIPIISCTGDYLGKTGYIVIDVNKDIRNVTVRLD
jgi:hypothetical protein